MSEFTREKKNMRIEEAAEAVVEILKEQKKKPVYKRYLFGIFDKMVDNNRRKDGYLFVPTIENREIAKPDKKFIENNWAEIREYCAEHYKKYVVWDPNGIRIGTFKEYQTQQSAFQNIAKGISKKHNKRAELINERGGESEFIEVQRLQIATGE